MNVRIIKYKGFKILLGHQNDMEQFEHNRAAFAQVFLAGNYDPLLMRIKSGDIVIDAGANIGMFTIRAAKIVGNSGSIIAVEPQDTNIEYLKENIRLNALKNVKVINKALYQHDNEKVHFGGMGVAGHISPLNSDKLVETISLSSIVSEFANQDFWLKMDIEGGEEFLFALDQDLSYLNKLKGIAYEIHSADGFSLLNSQLIKLGFKVGKVQHDNNFKKNIFIGFFNHPMLFIRLYRGRMISVAKRVLLKRNSRTNENCEFEPGMQYAWKV